METIKKINHWVHTHSFTEANFIRIVLGLFILYKGITFSINMEYLGDLVAPFESLLASSVIIHYIAIAHIAGGILILFGLITRIAIIFQIPILIGAVIATAFFNFNAVELMQSAVILAFLLFFLFYGSGDYSVDHEIGMEEE